MKTRRDFIRQGALWVAGAALVEPVTRKLWAFPVNPCAPSGVVPFREWYSYRALPDGYELERYDEFNRAALRVIRRGFTISAEWLA